MNAQGGSSVELDGERTETGELAASLQALLPALDAANSAPAPPGYPAFRGRVSEVSALPDEGAGLTTVLDELRVAIDHGCHINSAGFSGFITTGGTT
ncbi:MAG: hypothetical protein QOJ67_1732, partial [Acidimicrobiaceae bacterium]